jgi:hypothetical protein
MEKSIIQILSAFCRNCLILVNSSSFDDLSTFFYLILPKPSQMESANIVVIGGGVVGLAEMIF